MHRLLSALALLASPSVNASPPVDAGPPPVNATRPVNATPPVNYLDAELHAGIFAEAGNDNFLRALGALARVGRRWDTFGAFVVADFSTWRSPYVEEGEERQAALNLGVGMDLLWIDGFVRSTVAAGASVLLRGTEADEPGTTGLFLDLRPLSYRWRLADRWRLNFSPIGATILMPVLTGIPLVELQFRTALSGELSF